MTSPDAHPAPLSVHLRDETIRLGQFLKLTGVADDGALAKALLADGDVSVNGEVEMRRGRQLQAGDVVAVEVPDGVRTFLVEAQSLPPDLPS